MITIADLSDEELELAWEYECRQVMRQAIRIQEQLDPEVQDQVIAALEGKYDRLSPQAERLRGQLGVYRDFMTKVIESSNPNDDEDPNCMGYSFDGMGKVMYGYEREGELLLAKRPVWELGEIALYENSRSCERAREERMWVDAVALDPGLDAERDCPDEYLAERRNTLRVWIEEARRFRGIDSHERDLVNYVFESDRVVSEDGNLKKAQKALSRAGGILLQGGGSRLGL